MYVQYIIGCPYHSNYARGVSAFAYGVIQTGRLGRVTWNDVPINVGDEVSGGELGFEDGTRIVLTGSSSGLVVASFRMDDGRLYSIVRVLKGHGSATINVTVEPGSKFEVITPAAIAGVQGTKFRLGVRTVLGGDKRKTRVEMTQGTVEMRGRSGQVHILTAGEVQEIEEDDADCPDDPEE